MNPGDSRLSTPPILTSAATLFAEHKVIFCDVWGVLHDGFNAYPDAGAALVEYRRSGGIVVLVSNAPVPKHRVARMLALRNVDEAAWDDIVSSGDIAIRHVEKQGYKSIYGIGPADRDAALFSALPAPLAALDDADAIVITGLNDDVSETAENYRPLLETALTRNLPMVCANPDKVVDVGGTLYLCAGAVADLYEDMGGDVFWAGKPHSSAYGTAHEIANEIAGHQIAKSDILAVGDAVRTDIKAANTYGVACLFIAGGIHRDDVMADGAIDEERLAELFASGRTAVVGAMDRLRV